MGRYGQKTISLGKYEESLAVLGSPCGVADSGRHKAMKKAVMGAIKHELSEKQQSTLLMYYFEGKSIPEIAQLQGVNKSTVSRSLKSAKDKLGRILGYGFFPQP